MARSPRIDMAGYYHVLNRGVERRVIFSDDYDYRYFISLLDELRALYNFRIRAYCLMSNHYHLLVETTSNNLSLVLKQLNHRYTLYFNKKYNRIGTLWQGRFKSWYVYDEHYLNELVRYIEHNPIKAGMVKRVGEYKWSSTLSQSEPFFNADDTDGTTLSEFQKTKIVKLEDYILKTKLKTLDKHFQSTDRNRAVMRAVIDGYRQSDVAKHLKLSSVAISKIVKTEKAKEKLFERLKQNGIFWSYDRAISFRDMPDGIFIEHTLKYADFDDIVELLALYGKKFVFGVWEKELRNDLRFKKLNLFLARVFFGMNIESDYFVGEMSEREKKLRMLAS